MQVFPEVWVESDLASELPEMKRTLAAWQKQFSSRTPEQEAEYVFWVREANRRWTLCTITNGEVDLGDDEDMACSYLDP